MAFDLAVFFPDPETQAARMDPDVVSFPDGELIAKIKRGNSGLAWKGLQKLIQSVVIELFSAPLPDGTGSGLGELFDGTIRDVTSTSVQSIVAEKVEQTRINITGYQTLPGPTLTLDETLAGLSVIDVQLIEGKVLIDLDLETGAGENVQFTSAFQFI